MLEQLELNEILTKVTNSKNMSLKEMLKDKEAAKLGDAYLNFVYSLALSVKNGTPSGVKLSNKALAEAVKRSGLRSLMPSRLSRHDLGGSAEALLIHASSRNLINTRELLDTFSKHDTINALTNILKKIKEAIQKNENEATSHNKT